MQLKEEFKQEIMMIKMVISFLDSKGTGATGNTSFNNLPEPPMVDTSSNNMETVSVEKDPFEAFGDSIEISDNDLPF